MKWILVSLVSLNLSSSWASNETVAPQINESYILENDLVVHMGVYVKPDLPTKNPKADIMFFHGYGDQFLNHIPLFNKWVEAGFRVISFDFPSHGKTTGRFWKDLSLMSLKGIAEIAARVEKEIYLREKIPLLFAGWSVGGLIAARATQSDWAKMFARPISGLLLLAPALAVRYCVGNQICHITNETLTHNQALHNRTIKPNLPYIRPYFLGHMLWEIKQVTENRIDPSIPVLTILAGEKEDVYIKTKEAKKWVASQYKKGSRIYTLNCSGARHELDNEAKSNGGDEVKTFAVEFFNKVLEGTPSKYKEGVAASVCK
jgi:alpha-beta hydrolase superfamily lysophospholipase